MSYFGILDEFDDSPSWHDEWLEQNRLPSLVRVEMEFDNGMRWPAMVVALKLSSVDGSGQLGSGLFDDQQL